MDARGDLADTSLHASLITQIGDILATFTDDYASIFSTNKCTEGEAVLVRRGRGTRLRAYKADDKVSDHRWNMIKGMISILDSRRRVGELEDMERGGGAGGRKEEEGRRREGGGRCEEIRMTDRQQDTPQRGRPSINASLTRLFRSPLLIFSLSGLPVRVRPQAQKLNEGEVSDSAHRHYP